MQYVRLLCSHPDLVTTTKTSGLLHAAGGATSKNKNKKRRRSGQGREKEKDDVVTGQYRIRDSGKLVALLRLLAEAGIGKGPPKEEEVAEEEVMSKKKEEKTETMLIATPKNGWSHKILIFTSYKKTLDMLENVMFHSSVSCVLSCNDCLASTIQSRSIVVSISDICPLLHGDDSFFFLVLVLFLFLFLFLFFFFFPQK